MSKSDNDLVRIHEIYVDRETGEKLAFNRILDLESRLAKAVGALRVADEYLEFLASETNALDKKGERYLRWRESTNATKDLEET